MNTPVEEIGEIKKKVRAMVMDLAKIEITLEALSLYLQMTEGSQYENK